MTDVLKPIRTAKEHRRALARLDALMGAEADTPEAAELEVLAMLIERYERERFPIAAPTPLDAILFRMEQMGYAKKDLARVLQSKARATEILNRAKYGRGLSLAMIRRLHRQWRIPAEVLIQEMPPTKVRVGARR